MASPLVRDLLDAGVHFGHHCSRWNPKMAPYIAGRRNSIHIVDIRETVRGLLRAKKFLAGVVGGGGDVLFVGTKRQARESVLKHAERCGMHSVTERWLGGTLTNARTIRSRLKRLEELEELVGSPQWETGYSKKMKSTLTRELRKIRRNLDGIRKMSKLPGALVVIDVRKEVNALREARTLKIPTVCLIDTDSDPDYVSIPIPGNDDAMRAIELIVSRLADSVEEGKRARPEPAPEQERRDSAGGPGPGRRRSRRPASSDWSAPAAPVQTAEPAVAKPPATPEPKPEPDAAPVSGIADVGAAGTEPPAAPA